MRSLHKLSMVMGISSLDSQSICKLSLDKLDCWHSVKPKLTRQNCRLIIKQLVGDLSIERWTDSESLIEAGAVLDDFVTRYANKTTKKGHVVKVDVTETSASLWYLHWGEYKGVNDHHHFGIARITNFGDRYRVEWFEGTNTVPVSDRKSVV